METQLPVVAPPPGMKREAVSSRLRQTLVHPDKTGVLVGLGYTADGRRIFAGHYRSRIVQFWDAATGQQQNHIETGPAKIIGFRDYFQLSPNGRNLYVNCGYIGGRPVKGKDRRLLHYEVNSGDVRVWDVETGKSRYDLPLPPGRGVVTFQLSPDGATLLTNGVISGDYEPTNVKWFGTLWDARTGQQRGELPANSYARAAFSPDSKTLLINSVNDKSEATALLFLDAASGKVQRSLSLDQKHARVTYRAFSPDGKRVACNVADATTEESWLKCWDVASGREIASIEGEKKAYFRQPPVFSPDGHMLAVTHGLKKQNLYLIDAMKGTLVRIVLLAEECWMRQPVFSPDGKWIAILSQSNPTNRSPYRAKPEMLSQPHILLIEAATGEVRETIVAPLGIAVSLCFSPDGKTLASGGDGRVLLWDMTKPPGAWASAQTK